MLEQDILHSFILYPQDINEFLQGLDLNTFSKEGKALLEIILKLKDNNALNLNAFLDSVSGEISNTEYFINFLNANPQVNYINYKNVFLKNYRLKRQGEIASILLSATHNKELIDFESLDIKTQSQNVLKNLTQWQDYFNSKPPSPKFSTSISFLDSCFNGGLESGQLILISGDPEAGKTSLGIQILENIAKNANVCFFCFEFTIDSYLKQKTQNPLTQRAMDNIFIINDGYDINTIALNIKDAFYTKGTKVFLIDSQMRITSPNGRNMEEEESLKFSTLARLCHSLGIIVILIVQTSKGDRDNPMGSKKGGHEASIIIRVELLPPPKEQSTLKEYDENTRLIIVKKNKQTGKHFKEIVNFNPQTLYFHAQRDKDTKQVDNVISIQEIKEIIGNV